MFWNVDSKPARFHFALWKLKMFSLFFSFTLESSPFSNFIFRLFSGTLAFSYDAIGLVRTCSSDFSGAFLSISSSPSIPPCSGSSAVDGCRALLADRGALWSAGGAGLFIGGLSSLMVGGLLRTGGRRRMLDCFVRGAGALFSWFRSPACSQRFFRTLRLPERWDDVTLSDDWNDNKKKIITFKQNFHFPSVEWRKCWTPLGLTAVKAAADSFLLTSSRLVCDSNYGLNILEIFPQRSLEHFFKRLCSPLKFFLRMEKKSVGDKLRGTSWLKKEKWHIEKEDVSMTIKLSINCKKQSVWTAMTI